MALHWMDLNDYGQFSYRKRAASISWIWWRAARCLTGSRHLCWFHKCRHPAPIKHHPHQLQTHPKAITRRPAPPSDNHSCHRISAFPLKVQPQPTRGSFLPVLVLLCVAAAKQPDQHSLQLLNRLRKQRLDLADCGDCHFLLSLGLWWFMPHVCSPLTHFLFFPSLPVCLYLSLSLSPHANISSFLLSGAPDPKSTIPDVCTNQAGGSLGHMIRRWKLRWCSIALALCCWNKQGGWRAGI